MVGAIGLASPVWAAHSDLHVSVLGGQIQVNGDELLVDATTGYQLFEGDFGDLEGGLFRTDDPGFVAESGNFAAGSILGYRAQGTLQYWNGTSWGAVAGQERVHIADAFEEHSIFGTSGASGKLIGLIDQIGNDGVLHAHLDFTVENTSGIGNPAVGAYAIQVSLLALDQEFNISGTYGESAPFYLILNRGLSAVDFENAIDARVTAVPIPGAGALMGTALALGFGLAKRRNKKAA
jgi:hypothetical protein